MTIRANFFSTTQKFAVTSEPNSFTVPGPTAAHRAYFITSDTTVHVSRQGDATTEDAMRIPANIPFTISTNGGDVVSFVKGDSSDDGSLWATLTDR